MGFLFDVFLIYHDYMKKNFNKTEDILRAKSLANNQNFIEAVGLFKDILLYDPNDIEVKFLLGVAQLKSEQFESAINSLRECIEKSSDILLANHALGSALFMIEEYEASIRAFDREIAMNPSYADAYCDKGYALNELKRHHEALASSRIANQLDPSYADPYNVMAVSFNQLDQFDEAISNALLAISKDKSKPNYFLTAGNISLNQGNMMEALNFYEIALELNPNYEEAKFNKSVIFLRLLHFESGWEFYECRFATYPKKIRTKYTAKNYFDKNIDSLGRVFIFEEQGIGDQILFASTFHEIDKKENDIYIEINEKLMPVFKRTFKHLKFVTNKNHPDSKMYDSTFGIGSLPSFFRKSIDSFKINRNFFLHTDKSKVQEFRQKILSTNSLNKICGISWNSINETIGKHKSIALENLSDILIIPGITFVNLQYNPPIEEMESFKSKHNVGIQILNDVDIFNDIDSLFSLVDACDFVLTISNINAHIAGAIGKKTFLLAPFSKGRHWYWHDNLKQSLWYPSVEIFTQSKAGDWSEAIKEVHQKIVNEITL